jgi:hypothetical protein
LKRFSDAGMHTPTGFIRYDALFDELGKKNFDELGRRFFDELEGKKYLSGK